MTSEKTTGSGGRDFRRVLGMDPAANWLLGDGISDFLPEEDVLFIPLLLELQDDDAATAFEAVVARTDGNGRVQAVVLSFGQENRAIKPGVLLPVLVTHDWLVDLFDGSNDSNRFLSARKRIDISSPLENPARTVPGHLNSGNCDMGPVAGEGPIVAVIDHGLAFAHARFRDSEHSTRMQTFWDMAGNTPVPLPFKGELSKTEIDRLFCETDADEDEIYRLSGQLDYSLHRSRPLQYRISHGTHVLDLAAGAEPGEAAPPILAVQLPSPVIARTTGEILDFYIWVAILYILHRAGKRPVVINISAGYLAGSHDGCGVLESHLGRLCGENSNCTIIVPSGNFQLWQCHAEIDLLNSQTVELDLIVQPDDRTHSIVEIWLPPGTGDRVSLTITPPGRECQTLHEADLERVSGSLPCAARFHDGENVYAAAEFWSRPPIAMPGTKDTVAERRMIRLSVAPTTRLQPDNRPIAPAGRWTLQFMRGRQVSAEPIHAWVQRDDTLYGLPQGGRQSYFEHPDFVQFGTMGQPLSDDPSPPAGPACPVSRMYQLNALAGHPRVLVAGGYEERELNVAGYSSGGPAYPAEPGTLKKPDVLLPSEGSRVHRGVLAAASRSGSSVAQAGTSVAAPQLVRHVLKLLSGSKASVTRGEIKTHAGTSTISLYGEAATQRTGYGRLPRLDPPEIARFES
jgi:Subtilase family